ncbi:MAG: hypothetical protein JWM33_3667 [Caulobacteraceae bacterium]|nr:hypothetical protein [Caulobacteraceae bacterium]
MARLQTLAQRWQMLQPWVQVRKPLLSFSSIPAVILFHGCGGTRPYQQRYTQAALELGASTFIVDSYTPRGISIARAVSSICTGMEFRGSERAGDVLAAVWGVSQLWGIDRNRIILAGWSHGGWSIMDLMTMPLTSPGEAGLADPSPATVEKLAGLFLVYPYCGPPSRTASLGWKRSPPVQAVMGASDILAQPRLTQRALEAAQKCGSAVQSEIEPGATHAFDDDQQPLLSPYRFSPTASARSLELFKAFLKARLA